MFNTGAGAIPSPVDCYLLNRGLKTLALRMAQHQKNGLAVAKHLQTHDMIEEVRHPGMRTPSDPIHYHSDSDSIVLSTLCNIMSML